MDIRVGTALLLLTLLCGLHNSVADEVPSYTNWEHRVLEELFLSRGYNKHVRPVKHLHHTTNVSIGVTLISLKYDEYEGMLNTDLWLKLGWTDEFLSWNPEQFGGVTRMSIDSEKIWLPDLAIYNSKGSDKLMPINTMAVLMHDGSMIYVPPWTMNTFCSPNGTRAECLLKMGSWTRDGTQLDYNLNSDKVDVSELLDRVSNLWKVVDSSVVRNVKHYDCCKEAYMDVSSTLILEKRQTPDILILPIPELEKVEETEKEVEIEVEDNQIEEEDESEA